MAGGEPGESLPGGEGGANGPKGTGGPPPRNERTPDSTSLTGSASHEEQPSGAQTPRPPEATGPTGISSPDLAAAAAAAGETGGVVGELNALTGRQPPADGVSLISEDPNTLDILHEAQDGVGNPGPAAGASESNQDQSSGGKPGQPDNSAGPSATTDPHSAEAAPGNQPATTGAPPRPDASAPHATDTRPGGPPSDPDAPHSPDQPPPVDTTPGSKPPDHMAPPKPPSAPTSAPSQPASVDAATAAQQTQQKLEADHNFKPGDWDKMSAKDRRAALGKDYEKYREARESQREAEFDKKAEAIEKSTSSTKEEELKAIEEERVQARQKAILHEDDKYKENVGKRQSIEAKHPEWKGRTIYDSDDVPKGQQKEFENYTQIVGSIKAKERNAQYDAEQERARKGFGANGETLDATQAAQRVAKIEEARREGNVQDLLDADKEYRNYKLKYEIPLGKEKYSPEDLDKFARMQWGDHRLPFKDAHDFKEFVFAHDRAKAKKSIAEDEVKKDRRDKANVDEKGKEIKTSQERQAAVQRSMDDYDPGPGAVRRGLRWLNNGFGWAFGARVAHEKGREALKLGQTLIGKYGFWKGLILPKWFLGEDKETIVNMRRRMRGAIWGFAWREGFTRNIVRLLLLYAIIWVAQPIIMGKMLETLKPFGGNG